MRRYLALDVGHRRIGVARGDSDVKIAQPLAAVLVDGRELETLASYVGDEMPDCIIVGYPRNLAGEPTLQTKAVEQFAHQVASLGVPVIFQDETLSSVVAESRLGDERAHRKSGRIDSEAAAVILQDYLEEQHGH